MSSWSSPAISDRRLSRACSRSRSRARSSRRRYEYMPQARLSTTRSTSVRNQAVRYRRAPAPGRGSPGHAWFQIPLAVPGGHPEDVPGRGDRRVVGHGVGASTTRRIESFEAVRASVLARIHEVHGRELEGEEVLLGPEIETPGRHRPGDRHLPPLDTERGGNRGRRRFTPLDSGGVEDGDSGGAPRKRSSPSAVRVDGRWRRIGCPRARRRP